MLAFLAATLETLDRAPEPSPALEILAEERCGADSNSKRRSDASSTGNVVSTIGQYVETANVSRRRMSKDAFKYC